MPPFFVCALLYAAEGRDAMRRSGPQRANEPHSCAVSALRGKTGAARPCRGCETSHESLEHNVLPREFIATKMAVRRSRAINRPAQ